MAYPSSERRPGRDPEPLEQRIDRWVNTGRQLVEGVAGSRPGSRPPRRSDGRPVGRGGFDGLGRWVEDRLDWLLDDGDDWQEPWQEGARRREETGAPPRRERSLMERPYPDAPPTVTTTNTPRTTPGGLSAEAERAERTTPGRRGRRPLEAISRRGMGTAASASPVQPGDDQDWPDDDAFSVPRWQRPSPPLRSSDPLQNEASQPRRPVDGPAQEPPLAIRPLPRSSRRR